MIFECLICSARHPFVANVLQALFIPCGEYVFDYESAADAGRMDLRLNDITDKTHYDAGLFASGCVQLFRECDLSASDASCCSWHVQALNRMKHMAARARAIQFAFAALWWKGHAMQVIFCFLQQSSTNPKSFRLQLLRSCRGC